MLNIDTNILDDFLGIIKEAAPPSKVELKSTQNKELELWHHWNTNGRKPEHLKPLMDSLKPMINKEFNKWKRVEMPSSAIENVFKREAVKAIKSYNPNNTSKAGLGTWVHGNLRKASRYVKIYQNFGKIPEQNIGLLRVFRQARSDLTDKIGFDPDSHQLAEHLGWSKKKVEQMIKEDRKDLPASKWGSDMDPAESLDPKELEAIRLVQYDLTPEERTVYEYTFGMNGKPMLKPGDIAKKATIHPSKVSRIRNKLQKKIQEAVSLL